MTNFSDTTQEAHRLANAQSSGDPFAAAFHSTRMPMVITDPRQPDNPLVFANDAFLELTGYTRAEVIGRNCRFLQGPATSAEAVASIRHALENGHPAFRGDILNYRKDGSTFWNALYITPVTSGDGTMVYNFASLHDVTADRQHLHSIRGHRDQLEREVRHRTLELEQAVDALKRTADAKTALLHEVDHRIKNNLQTISALVQLQAKRIEGPTARQALMSMKNRIDALSTVHRGLYQSDDVKQFDIAAFARELASDLVGASRRDDIDVALDLETIRFPVSKAVPLALVLNELVTNAVKHAFVERGGRIGIGVRRAGSAAELRVEDDGAGMGAEMPDGPSFGRTIVDILARQLNAQVEWTSGSGTGTRVRLALPLSSVEAA